jgi:hypothetical protein
MPQWLPSAQLRYANKNALRGRKNNSSSTPPLFFFFSWWWWWWWFLGFDGTGV